MCDVTLVSTRHHQIGACNSEELCQIIDGIQPDVIFLEMPSILFDQFFVEKTRSNLEVQAIGIYFENNSVELVPVDLNDMPTEYFLKNYRHAVEKVEGLADVNGFNYRNTLDNNKRYSAMYGFNYLNSNSYIAFNDEIYDALEKGLVKINDDNLLEAYRLWNRWQDKRENEMLQNIINYTQEHSYNRAIFFLGAAHRKSIIKKIQSLKNNGIQNINWLTFGENYSSV